MSRVTLENNDLFSPRVVADLLLGCEILAIGAAHTIAANSAPLKFIDPTGTTRVVTLPAAKKGAFYIFVNTEDATASLTIKNAAADTLGTVTQGQSCIVVSDGTSWFVAFVGASTYVPGT